MTSLKTVGDENLPNLFIDKIYVYHYPSSERFVKKIRVFLSAFDHRDSPSWFNRPELVDMKIKVALISHEPLVESLNNGTSLVDIEVPSLFDPDRLLHIPPYQAFYKRESLNPIITEELGDFIKYIYRFEFEIEPPQSSSVLVNDLNLYCCFYMDGFGFNIPQFDKYYGPMDGEVIYSGGEINQESGYFYYPDTNEEYSGPVHVHEDIYMEGSVHSDSPHKEVKYVKINNLKIKLINLEDTLIDDADGDDSGLDSADPLSEDAFENTTPSGGVSNSDGGYAIE